ncbi:MAG: ATP synthase F1 subunit delta [Bacteroidetes bacterium]|nr:MAG: ATP synthase F1 subunit delta [Bacteroidota bacterium]
MSVQRISSRYAKSLIDLAQERDCLERIVEDIRHFNEVCEVRDFHLLLKSPIVNASTKKSVFERLFKESYDPLTMAFLNIILRKGREMYLENIAKEFVQQYRDIKRIAAVTFTTATGLESDQLEKIKNLIADSGATYENVELESSVDPDILGGFIIEFDHKLYDASVAHRLDELRKEFS